MSCIIAFTKIDGVWGYLNIDRVLTNQGEYTLKGITSNEDVSEFTDNVLSLYDMAIETGTRLGYKDERKGRYVFDTGKNKPFWWDGDEWVDALGLNDSTLASGPFAYRPSSSKIQVGHSYFCTDRQTTEGTTNGIMIYHKGEDVWVDALGRVVEQ